MMRGVVLVATALFWLGVASFAWHGWHDSVTPPADAGSPASAAPAASAPAVDDRSTRRITPTELARHAHSHDCWLAIDGAVYDVSTYGPLHPAEPEVLSVWCGREASAAYRTKGYAGSGRPHSARADAMLPRYRVGTLAPAN